MVSRLGTAAAFLAALGLAVTFVLGLAHASPPRSTALKSLRYTPARTSISTFMSIASSLPFVVMTGAGGVP